MSDVIIRASGLGKKYTIGHALERQRYTALRDVVAASIGRTWRRVIETLRGGAVVIGDAVEEFWALDGLDFEVKRGEVVGIVGRNGAGKTTLLKILSRITEPSTGRVEICGRVASLLEVGTGFHPELTGRENIYLNGAILGMTRAEIRRKFDEIVAFADVEKFIDTPVKRYSSGMYVRLAFAVAAHLEPEILIVDEVLAVGDAEFQRKCLGKMQDVAGHGRTVLFVSHNMAAVEQLCSRAILLDGGRVALEGATRDVVSGYLAKLEEEVLEFTPESDPRRAAEITRVTLCDQMGTPLRRITSADTPNVKIELIVRERRRDLKFAFLLHDSRHDTIFSSCPPDDDVDDPNQPGHYEFQAAFPAALLMAQRYSITVSLYSGAGEHIHVCWHALVFDVSAAATKLQTTEPNRMGVLQIECRWKRSTLPESGVLPEKTDAFE